MTNGPFEPPGGQDDPPDPATAIRAVLRLFTEILARDGLDADDLKRIAALSRALKRLLEAEDA